MASNTWIQSAVNPKDKGKYTARAKAEGESMAAAESKDIHSKNKVTRGRALFAKNMRALAKERKGVK
jgi:hypothetical protein